MTKKALLASVSAATLLLAGAGVALADQGAEASINYDDATVYLNDSRDYGSRRDNTIDDILPSAGVMHVQQNNGSTNEMGAASSVQYGINSGADVETGASVKSVTGLNYTVNEGGLRTNDVLDSFNGFTGVLAVQQNNGDNNSIGIANAIHGNIGSHADVSQGALAVGVTGLQFSPEELLVGYVPVFVGPRPWDWDLEPLYIEVPGALTDAGSERHNVIDPSFMGAKGVVSVQQNNGNGNAMGIANSVVLNTGAGDVGQVAATLGLVGLQSTADFSADRDNSIDDNSFDSAQGIMNVQQNNGDANVMGIANAVSANFGPVAAENDVDQIAASLGLVIGAEATDYDANYPSGQRDNWIGTSFDSANGILNVQQNNGSNNVMGIANAVQANVLTGRAPLGTHTLEEVGTQFALSAGGAVHGAAAQSGTALTPTYSGPAHRENDIHQSFDSMDGLATVQQNEGDNNVIGAANAVVANSWSADNTDKVRGSSAATVGLTKASVAVEEPIGVNRDNHITSSFTHAEGVLTVQQNNGNNNVMGAANSVVANRHTDDISANEASNGAFGFAKVEDNSATTHAFTDRVNRIDNNGFFGVQGIVTVQQNNGDNNVMGAATAVTVDISEATVHGFGPAASTAALSATVTGNTTVVAPTEGLPGLSNVLNGNAFSFAKGVITVQQNNGSNNAIQSAIAVSANLN